MYTGLILRVHLECAGLVSFPFLQGLKSQMKVRPRARLYVYSVSNPSVVPDEEVQWVTCNLVA